MCTEDADGALNIELKNANTIAYTESTNEQIDNAELQGKGNDTNELDDNENDKDSKIVDSTTTGTPEIPTTTPVEADLNNGPFTDES